MKITKIEDLHAASGLGHFSFLKISTDEGLVGWAEFNEGSGSKALTGIIRAIGEQLIGKDPLPVQKIATQLYQQTVQAPGGMNQRANAATRDGAVGHQGKVAGRARLFAVRRPGARPRPGLLVALRLLPDAGRAKNWA